MNLYINSVEFTRHFDPLQQAIISHYIFAVGTG